MIFCWIAYIQIRVWLQQRKIILKIAIKRKESNHVFSCFIEINAAQPESAESETEKETERLKAELRRYFTRISISFIQFQWTSSRNTCRHPLRNLPRPRPFASLHAAMRVRSSRSRSSRRPRSARNRSPGTNCIKIGLPGKLILRKRKGLPQDLFS